MAPLWQQRRDLVEENAHMIRQWLLLLDEDKQEALLRSLVIEFTLYKLKVMNTHIKEQLAVAQKTKR